MPFTPFHFGPGLFVKGIFARHYSFAAFVVTQIIIDCETLYFMISGAYPIHRFCHTVLGGSLVGLLVALLLMPCRVLLIKLANHYHVHLLGGGRIGEAEFSKIGVLVGGLFGGISHSIFDANMHPDVRPFQPWSNNNPFLDMVELNVLHAGFLFLGIIGYVVVHYQLKSYARAG